MSRALQWVIGISVALVALAAIIFVLSVAIGWSAPWSGYGMTQAPAPWAGVSGTAAYGMMGGTGGYGMMGGNGWTSSAADGERLSLDQAVSSATDYAAAFPGKLAVAEVME